jgi:hypothetical protein
VPENEPKKVVFSTRVPTKLKEHFVGLVKMEGLSVEKVVTEWMRKYVAERWAKLRGRKNGG